MRIASGAFFSFALCCATLVEARQTAPSARVAPSIVKIAATQCIDGRDRSASGFVFRDSKSLVSTLHSVRGCGRVIAWSEARNRSFLLEIDRVLEGHDLVLLSAREDVARPLSLSPREVAVDETLYGVGYLLAAPTISDRRLRVALGKSTLGDMLPKAVRDRVSLTRSPALETPVIRIDGTLVPGMSGAPIVDSSGYVVGIADGGLEGGMVAISWAVKARALPSLLSSSDRVAKASRDNSTLFAADLEEGPAISVPVVDCGALTFKLTHRRTLSELIAFDDDPKKGAKLMRAFGISSGHADVLRYDIWTETRSGAAIALPEDTYLSSESSGVCTASPTVGIYFTAVGTETKSTFDQSNKIKDFLDGQIRPSERERVVVDKAWSDPGPRPVGKSNMNVQRSAVITNPSGKIVRGYLASTVLTRGAFTIGASVKSSFVDPYSDHPRRTDERILLGQFLIGLHMSTFPPS